MAYLHGADVVWDRAWIWACYIAVVVYTKWREKGESVYTDSRGVLSGSLHRDKRSFWDVCRVRYWCYVYLLDVCQERIYKINTVRNCGAGKLWFCICNAVGNQAAGLCDGISGGSSRQCVRHGSGGRYFTSAGRKTLCGGDVASRVFQLYISCESVDFCAGNPVFTLSDCTTQHFDWADNYAGFSCNWQYIGVSYTVWRRFADVFYACSLSFCGSSGGDWCGQYMHPASGERKDSQNDGRYRIGGTVSCDWMCDCER